MIEPRMEVMIVATYRCQACGWTAPTARKCCGKTMKKVK